MKTAAKAASATLAAILAAGCATPPPWQEATATQTHAQDGHGVAGLNFTGRLGTGIELCILGACHTSVRDGPAILSFRADCQGPVNVLAEWDSPMMSAMSLTAWGEGPVTVAGRSPLHLVLHGGLGSVDVMAQRRQAGSGAFAALPAGEAVTVSVTSIGDGACQDATHGCDEAGNRKWCGLGKPGVRP